MIKKTQGDVKLYHKENDLFTSSLSLIKNIVYKFILLKSIKNMVLFI